MAANQDWRGQGTITKSEFHQSGLDWLPKNSPARELDWSGRMKPVRLYSNTFKRPLDYTACFNCYEEALWYCSVCRIKFCRYEDCKAIHEYEHLLSRMAGGQKDVEDNNSHNH
ncbi:MAG: hypothetical protein MN733_44400 [Nitrososphaera sp.]|nr:hypothetical protein [Nitrososphaera sp.]